MHNIPPDVLDYSVTLSAISGTRFAVCTILLVLVESKAQRRLWFEKSGEPSVNGDLQGLAPLAMDCRPSGAEMAFEHFFPGARAPGYELSPLRG